MHDLVPIGQGPQCNSDIAGRQPSPQKSTQRIQHRSSGRSAVCQGRAARQVEITADIQALDVRAGGFPQNRIVPVAARVGELVLEELDLLVLSFMDETRGQGPPIGDDAG